MNKIFFWLWVGVAAHQMYLGHFDRATIALLFALANRQLVMESQIQKIAQRIKQAEWSIRKAVSQ